MKHLQQLVQVLAPGNAHGGRAQRVLHNQGPADNPGHELAHRGVGVGVGRAGNGNHGGELGVAQAGKHAADGGHDESQRHARPGGLRGGGGGAHKQAGPDDGAHAQGHEVAGAQGALQGAVAGGVGLAQEHGQRFFGENTCHVLGVKEEEV